jgi:galactokinase
LGFIVAEFDDVMKKIEKLYANDESTIKRQRERYRRLDAWFLETFGQEKRQYFSTPGRTEIGGNHTDHNHGRVLAASVDLDSIAVAAPTDDQRVTLFSEGYDESFLVDLKDLGKRIKEKGKTSSLIRGIAARLKEQGWNIGGFNACLTSDVLPGSGLSSSASVEVLIGSIFNAFYNNNTAPAEELAQIGQFAENEYFGKPCGLMDQMACAVGGIITIDFENPEEPRVEKVDFDFDRQHYNMLVVDTGGNHTDLTPDYAAVPSEMKAVARLLGKQVCRDLTESDLQKNMSLIRKELGDRALLRAYHFLNENQRVADQVDALERNDFEAFLQLVKDSGNSSFKWLQNVYTTKNVREQGVSLALALSEDYIDRTGEGACRVHGGGFAGTILTFLPERAVAGYIPLMESVFGDTCVKVLSIRPEGTFCFTNSQE